MHAAYSIRTLGVTALVLLASVARAEDWPQWFGPQRDGVWREQGLVERFPQGGPKVLWRMKNGGGYAGPAVADGRVYVTDRVLDAGQKDPANPFSRTSSTGQERVLCLDAKTGKELWKHAYPSKYTMSYPCGPRATPAVAGGKVYTLGAMGDLLCLDAASGKVIWSRNFVKDFDASVPVWGFTAHPLVDGDRLICLVGNKPAVVAFDRHTGKELWRSLDTGGSEIGYCPPMIFTIAGKRQLVVWHPEAVAGLEIESGKKLWSYEWLVRANLTISTPRQIGNRLFLTAFYNGSRLLEIGEKNGNWEVQEIWKSNGRGERPGQTDKLHAIMCTPVIQGEHIYGVCSYGELRCLTLKEGKRVWSDLRASGAGKEPERWANAFLVEQGDRFFIFNEKGDLMIARLSPRGYEEIDRAHILDPTGQLAAGFSSPRKVVWSHPAFADRAMFARNDQEIVAVSLAR
ncbi:MAG: PQQ-binding-like beta-propeller repeat protein [Gemmataceae bacterium]